MDKKQVIRLTENDIRRIVRESVENVISEVSAMPKGFKHRFDPDKRDGDFPLEQPEWTKDPRWQGWNGEDPEWIMKQEKESGDPYYGNKKQAKVSESQLHQIVKESVEQVLNEVSPEYYTNAANTAQNSINGFKGKMMKTFMPKQYNKRQRQATQFRDMSNDHPQDEWEITNQQMGSNPYDAQTYYTLRNTRTGEQRGYNDGNKEKPFRGRVIAGQGGDNESASWLNNKQYNPSHR